MKLTFVLLVTVASLAAGSPHGYGVKGGSGAGAAARAEATAVAGAGAFNLGGAAPLTAPGGDGSYSGSFSKSSASSFAASSASASSFSYSGAGGFSGAGAPNGGSGFGGSTGYSGAPKSDGGNGYGAYSGAQSAAAAAAGAFALAPSFGNAAPCTGDCASKTSAGCQGDSCGSPLSGPKCTSGQCGTNYVKPIEYDSDDIPVHFASTPKNSYDDNGINSKKSPKTPCSSGNCEGSAMNIPVPTGSYQPSNTKNYEVPTNENRPPLTNAKPTGSSYHTYNGPCASGNCASPAMTNTNPTSSYSQNPSNSYQPNCDSPNCGASSPSPPSPSYPASNKPYPEPSKLLTTPKEDLPEVPKCSTPNCGSDSYSPNLPSSYNVPITGSYPKKPSTSCTSGNCPYSPSNASPSKPPNSYNPGFPHKDNQGRPCNTPDCAGPSPSRPGISSFPTMSPSYNAPVLQGPPNPSSNCAHGKCGNAPYAPAHQSGSLPTSPPSYTHGPSSPQYQTNNPVSSPGCASGNCGNNPPFQQGPFKPVPAQVGAPSNCPGGNCGGSPPQLNPNDPDPNSFIALEPNSAASPTKVPAYHGSFGGPSGILKPNEYSVPVKPASSQHSSPRPNPSYDSPVALPSIPIEPTGGYSPQANPQPSASVPQYSGSGSQSSANAVAGASAFAYTGGFGGPPGFLKPFDGGKGSPSSTGGKYGASPNSVPSGVTPGHGQYGSGSSAGAFADTGAFGGGYGHQGGQEYHGHVEKDYNGGGHGGGGCNGGCGGNGGGGHGGGLGISTSFGSGFGLGLAKTGLDALAGGINGAVSAAKSISGAVSSAGAGSGAGSFGLSGSFASSAASSGAATKGGYGR